MPQRNTRLSEAEISRILEIYKNTGSVVKTRKLTGHGHKAISKYLKEAGIVLNGHKKGNGGDPRKITDEELIAESKYMTRVEIAKKHGMNLCNVDRKLKRLGISCKSGVGLGSSHSHYMERCITNDVEYDRNIDLFEVIKKYNGICAICGRPVDVTDKGPGYIKKDYPTIDHIIPLSKGGTHTWGNVQLAHMICNSIKRDR